MFRNWRDDMANGSTRIIGQEIVLKGKVINRVNVHIEETFNDGTNIKIREMAVRHQRIVCVLPIAGDKIILILQPRIYFDENGYASFVDTLEFPAGKEEIFDKGNLAAAAGRELREETGYKAAKLEFLFEESVSAGCLGEKRYCYLARNIIPGEKENSHESEQIRVIPIDKNEIVAFIKQAEKDGIKIDSGVRSMLFEIRNEI